MQTNYSLSFLSFLVTFLGDTLPQQVVKNMLHGPGFALTVVLGVIFTSIRGVMMPYKMPSRALQDAL